MVNFTFTLKMMDMVMTTAAVQLYEAQSSSQIVTTNKPTSGFLQA